MHCCQVTPVKTIVKWIFFVYSFDMVKAFQNFMIKLPFFCSCQARSGLADPCIEKARKASTTLDFYCAWLLWLSCTANRSIYVTFHAGATRVPFYLYRPSFGPECHLFRPHTAVKPLFLITFPVTLTRQLAWAANR
jgi:hypothetical protein